MHEKTKTIEQMINNFNIRPVKPGEEGLVLRHN